MYRDEVNVSYGADVTAVQTGQRSRVIFLYHTEGQVEFGQYGPKCLKVRLVLVMIRSTEAKIKLEEIDKAKETLTIFIFIFYL